MAEHLRPDTYIEEVDSPNKPIEAVSTSAAVFVGLAKKGKLDDPVLITSWPQFVTKYGGFYKSGATNTYLPYAVYSYFANGGQRAYINRIDATAASAVTASVAVTGNTATTITAYAASQGVWGNSASVTVEDKRMAETTLVTATTSASTLLYLSSVENIYPGSIMSISTGTTLSASANTTATTINIVAGLVAASGDTLRIDDEYLLATAAIAVGATTGGVLRAQDGSTAANHSSAAKVHHVNDATMATVCVAEVNNTAKSVIVDQALGASVGDGGVFATGTSIWSNEFDLKVYYGGDLVETWENLCRGSDDASDTHGSSHPRYVTSMLGQTLEASEYVYLAVGTYVLETHIHENMPKNGESFTMASGSDGTWTSLATTDFVFTDLDTATDAGMLVLPAAYNLTAATDTVSVINSADTYCEGRMDMFAIHSTTNYTGSNAVTNAIGQVNTMNSSSYGAVYFPWLKVTDRITNGTIQVPPIGHIAGIYAKTDIKKGVHYSPAGQDLPLVDLKDVVYDISNTDNNSLLPKKINPIRKFNGVGTVLWGVRTLSANATWRYINVRRWMAMIEESIQTGTRPFVFANNNATTWNSVKATIGSFLYNQFLNGAMAGTTPATSYYVACDSSTNPQSKIDVGELSVEIGVAPNKPAEFIIIKIGMWTAGASVTES